MPCIIGLITVTIACKLYYLFVFTADDKTSVKLMSKTGGTDYINANYVDVSFNSVFFFNLDFNGIIL